MQRVVGAMSDLFFAVKVNDVLKSRGMELKLANSVDDVFAKLGTPTVLVVVDLNDRAMPALELVARLKQDGTTRNIPVLAFSSHVQAELMQQAKQCGVEAVVARSVFASKLPDLIDGLVGKS
jgi:CheY-like chemotaxis protein